jgi:putative nucleotidyltransferase with HDIG domain
MKTKVSVNDLCKGMYVTELDRPWLGTPFLFQGFEISTDDELQTLRELCRHVFVLEGEAHQVAIRRTVTTEPPMAPPSAPSSPKLFVSHLPGHPANRPTATPAAAPLYPDLVPVEQEIHQAMELETGVRETLYSMLDDGRAGKRLDVPRARRLVNQMAESVIRNPDALVWLTQLKKKHEYTATHSLRVSVLALALGRHIGYDRETLTVLGIGALLHDIGKLKVPNELLDKPESLTREEFEIMKNHVPEGLKLLDGSRDIPAAALEVVGRHHERYSGNGYVFGLSGDAIGEFGLISAIVDTYDAITSDRAYHLSLSAADALKIIYEGRERAYHPWLVEQFIQCMGIYPIGSIVELSSGAVGVVIAANRERRLRPRVALILSPDKRPYTPATIVDLTQVTRDSTGRPLEIRKVLPTGSFGINPIDHMPVRH